MSKRYDEPIEVETGGPPKAPHGAPRAFRWRGRQYAVSQVLKHWRETNEAWDPERAKESDLFRVEAEGGTYDLRFDRLAGREQAQWRLARVWD